MSKYLIIFANPNHEGHGAYLLKKLSQQLEENNLSYAVLDLYQLNYDPTLKSGELKKGPAKILEPITKTLQAQIQAASNLIFIYPVWWKNMPAILKGFLDRTFSGGFAFKYENGRSVPLLKGKKAVVFCSTASSHNYFNSFKNQQAAKLLSQDVLAYCGIESKNFVFSAARKLNDNKLRLEKTTAKILRYLS